MAKTLLSVKTDPAVKKEAQRVARELGVPLSTVVNAYLKEFIREKEMRLSLAPKMSSALERLIAGVEKDLTKGRNLSPIFASPKEMDAYLAPR